MNDHPEINKSSLMQKIDETWTAFNRYIDTLSEEQLTQPADAAGWTAKDHIIHLAIWEKGILALLNHESRISAMGLSEWEDYDVMNAKIQQKHKDMPLNEVLDTFKQVHEATVQKLESMSDEALMLPYKHYAPEFDRDQPVILWVAGNTFDHYLEHRDWIEVMINS